MEQFYEISKIMKAGWNGMIFKKNFGKFIKPSKIIKARVKIEKFYKTIKFFLKKQVENVAIL